MLESPGHSDCLTANSCLTSDRTARLLHGGVAHEKEEEEEVWKKKEKDHMKEDNDKEKEEKE